MQSSKQYDIHFNGGTGYGFFVKHDLMRIAEKTLYLRYMAIISNHNANLPEVVSDKRDSEYKFSNFSIDVFYEFYINHNNKYYTGMSLNLLRTVSRGKFRADYNGNSIYPSLFIGWARIFLESFDAFSELRLDYGKTDADGGPEELPVSGISLIIGLTMYISQ